MILTLNLHGCPLPLKESESHSHMIRPSPLGLSPTLTPSSTLEALDLISLPFLLTYKRPLVQHLANTLRPKLLVWHVHPRPHPSDGILRYFIWRIFDYSLEAVTYCMALEDI